MSRRGFAVAPLAVMPAPRGLKLRFANALYSRTYISGYIKAIDTAIAIIKPPALRVRNVALSIIPAASRYGHARSSRIMTKSCTNMM